MPVLLHTRIRVSDLERSIQFYTEHLGFTLTGRSDRSPAGNQLAFLKMGEQEHMIELTYSPDYELNVPEDLMHFAIGYPDLIAKCEELESKGIEIWPDDWREVLKTHKMAFIDDPDGYEIELLERK